MTKLNPLSNAAAKVAACADATEADMLWSVDAVAVTSRGIRIRVVQMRLAPDGAGGSLEKEQEEETRRRGDKRQRALAATPVVPRRSRPEPRTPHHDRGGDRQSSVGDRQYPATKGDLRVRS